MLFRSRYPTLFQCSVNTERRKNAIANVGLIHWRNLTTKAFNDREDTCGESGQRLFGHSGRTRAVTTCHDASRWAQQPLPPTTNTEVPCHLTTTTTTNMDLDILYRITRLRHFSLFSFARFHRCCPSAKVSLQPPPSGPPTIAYLRGEYRCCKSCVACLSLLRSRSLHTPFCIAYCGFSFRLCSASQLVVLYLGVLNFSHLPAFSLLFHVLGEVVFFCSVSVFSTTDRKSTRLNSSHSGESRMPSSA